MRCACAEHIRRYTTYTCFQVYHLGLGAHRRAAVLRRGAAQSSTESTLRLHGLHARLAAYGRTTEPTATIFLIYSLPACETKRRLRSPYAYA
jgi:hypothetical protein